MELTVISGGRDDLERELVEGFFKPWEYDYDKQNALLEKLRPRGRQFISAVPSPEHERSLPHQAGEEQD